MHYWTQCIIYFESFIHLTFRFLHFAVTTSVRADLQKIQNHENQYNDCEKSVFNIQRICCIFFHNFTNKIALKLEKERKYLINKLFKFSRGRESLQTTPTRRSLHIKTTGKLNNGVDSPTKKKSPSRAVCLFELMNKSRIMTIKTTFAHHVLLLFFLVKFFLCLNTNN